MTLEEYFNRWLLVIDKKELVNIVNKISILYNTKKCTPEYHNIFKVFNATPYDDIKIIMLFQDPYPQQGIATGVALGNKTNTEKLSPSLEVVKESVINFEKSHNCCTFDPTLEEWSKQGVLLLNSALTVEVGKPGSHSLIWREFIKKFLTNLGEYNPGLIYVLWGNSAKSFEHYIKNPTSIIKLPHPSYYARNNIKIPYSVFTNLNKLVKANFAETIEWFKEINFNDNDNYDLYRPT